MDVITDSKGPPPLQLPTLTICSALLPPQPPHRVALWVNTAPFFVCVCVCHVDIMWWAWVSKRTCHLMLHQRYGLVHPPLSPWHRFQHTNAVGIKMMKWGESFSQDLQNWPHHLLACCSMWSRYTPVIDSCWQQTLIEISACSPELFTHSHLSLKPEKLLKFQSKRKHLPKIQLSFHTVRILHTEVSSAYSMTLLHSQRYLNKLKVGQTDLSYRNLWFWPQSWVEKELFSLREVLLKLAFWQARMKCGIVSTGPGPLVPIRTGLFVWRAPPAVHPAPTGIATGSRCRLIGNTSSVSSHAPLCVPMQPMNATYTLLFHLSSSLTSWTALFIS